MDDTDPPHGGLTFIAEDAAIVIEALEYAAHPQLAAQAENLLGRLGPETVAAFEPEPEQEPDERQRLRARLLMVIGSQEGPGQMEYEVADTVASMPGDICAIVTRWVERASRAHRRQAAHPDGQAAPGPDVIPPGEALEAQRREALMRAVIAVVDQAPAAMSQDERTIAVAEALLTREMFTDRWCPACQATAEGMCADHDRGSDLVDEFRRHAYKRLPGSPEIDT
jgi:hypothetical protein